MPKKDPQQQQKPQQDKPAPDAKPPGMVNRPDEVPAQDQTPVMAEKKPNLVEQLYTGMVEQTYAVSPYVPASMLRPYNPDDLFRKRNDYGIYEEMAQDDQVSICLQLKKDLVLGAGWDIVIADKAAQTSAKKDPKGQDPNADPAADPTADPAQPTDPEQDPSQDPGDDQSNPEDDADQQIKDELMVTLDEQCEGSFDDMLSEMLTAYEFGFSLTEKVFQTNPDGMLGLKYLRTRHPASWLIHTDDQGRIEKYEQRVGAVNKGAAITGLDVDPKSLIHYINSPRFQNPYGISDLRAAYNAYFVKRQVIKYYAIFLEKAASPIPWAQYDKNAPAQAREDIFNALKSFQNKTALVVPKELEVAFLEAKNTGEAYDKAINIFNMFIGRALFIPDLLGFQGKETGGGSYALGKDQIRIFMHHIGKRRKKLEDLVNKHIIRPLVLFNYGDMEKYPKFRLRPLDDELAVDLAKVWVDAVKGKVFKPNDEEINYFRALCKFPEGEVQEDDPAQPTDPTTGMPLHPNDPRNPNSPTHPMNSKDPKVADDAQKKAASTPLTPPPPPPGVGQKKKLSSSKFAKKVNFTAIEAAMDRFKAHVMEQAKPVIQAAITDLYRQAELSAHPDRVNELTGMQVSPLIQARLKSILQNDFREAHAQAKNQASQELGKMDYKAPVPNEKFMEFLDSEANIFVNDWAQNMTKAARDRVMAAIRDGIPLSQVFDAPDNPDIEDAEVSLERYARTAFTDVMNRGRKEYFESSGIVAAYEYSAILDDRTSDICAGLDGKIFEADNAPTPPLHWNCRSLLIPITTYEDYEADTRAGGQPIDKFIAENKGEGFASK